MVGMKGGMLMLLCGLVASLVGAQEDEFIKLEDIVEPHHPLWPGSLYTYEDRDRAIMKGIVFLEKQSQNDTHFLQHARDYMLGMKLVAQSSHNHQIVTSASKVGKDMTERWSKAHASTDPAMLDKDELRLLTGDIFNGKRYGVESVEPLLAKVKAVLSTKKFSDFFTFQPIVSAPKDTQDPVSGRVVSRWEEWQNALIFAYVLKELGISTLEGNGLTLYLAVLKWLPDLKPYTHVMDTGHFIPNLSAVLQLVYTLSDYEFLTLDKDLLADEYGLLQQSLPVAIDYFQSVEAVGELVDCLKTFGDRESSPNIQRGLTYLLAEQNANGAWGGEQEKALGIEHHTTIVALWGLREKLDHGTGPKNPEVMAALKEAAKRPSQIQQQLGANQFASNLAHMMQAMGLNMNLPMNGMAGMPSLPGLPGIPGMPHNPFQNFHASYNGDGSVPQFKLSEEQQKYMQMQQAAQEAQYKQYQQQQQQQMEAQAKYYEEFHKQQEQMMAQYQKAAQAQGEKGGADAGAAQPPPGMGAPSMPMWGQPMPNMPFNPMMQGNPMLQQQMMQQQMMMQAAGGQEASAGGAQPAPNAPPPPAPNA